MCEAGNLRARRPLERLPSTKPDLIHVTVAGRESSYTSRHVIRSATLTVLVALVGCGDNFAGPLPDAAAAPDAADALVPDAGAVPVAMFAQTAYIKSTQPITEVRFGTLAMSAAGDTLVAAQRDGVVNVYARDPSWRVAAEIIVNVIDFGST